MRSRNVILNVVRLGLLVAGVVLWIKASRISDSAVMCTAVYSGHYPDEVSKNVEATCAALWWQTERYFLLGGLAFVLVLLSLVWRRLRVALAK
jgi:hypothetical protein